MQHEGLFRLEMDDVLARAERARQTLISSVERLPDHGFLTEAPPEWSAGRILRHLVWTEFYWTLSLQFARAATSVLVEIDDDANLENAREASRRAGTPPEPVAAIPPYDTKIEALTGLAASRAEFLAAVRSLDAAHLQKRVSTRRGVVPLRFLIEHVILHDWEHAVQITGLRTGR